MTWRLGVDVGGTFTDVAIVSEADGRIGITKVPTTTSNVEEGVLNAINQGLARYGVPPSQVSLLSHGTTVVTNALLEMKGARAGFVSTKGFRDILELRRSSRASLYDLFQDGPSILIPRRYRYEITERVDAKGRIVTPISEDDIDTVIAQIRDAGIETVAVSFLFSFLNDRHEQLMGARIRSTLPGVQVFLSSEVLPEIREFERASTTAVCAYVAPILRKYLNQLEGAVAEQGLPRVYVMGSSGGMIDTAESLRMPALIVESGPAAGVIASAHVGKQLKMGNLIAFDMGGTTAKASLIADGEVTTTAEYEVGGSSHMSRSLLGTGHPIRVPVIDIAEVSSGGGSIAWIDSGGALRVGPQSAGSTPGPAAYGRGGTKPTVSDANVVLGYLDRTALLDGALRIDYAAAEKAIYGAIAQPLGISTHEAACRIVEVVNNSMAEALRIVSIERGHDPREFSLICFGGAGPIHAAELAQELQMPEVLVPPAPGAFSALGLVTTDFRRDYSRSLYGELRSIDCRRLSDAFDLMQTEAQNMFEQANISPSQRSVVRFADVRYRRQAYELTVPVADGPISQSTLDSIAREFNHRHRLTYGHADDAEIVQLVNVRLSAIGHSPALDIKQKPNPDEARVKTRDVWLTHSGFVPCQVYWRNGLEKGREIKGLAIVEAMDSTVVIPCGWTAVVDEQGFIRMRRS